MKKILMNLPQVIIDSHCHGRDMEQSHKTTLKQTILEATSSGIGVSVFMPNTTPSITSIETLNRYVRLMREACRIFGIKRKQYLYFGLTDENLAECEIALGYPEVIGLKDYPLSKSGKTVTTGTIGVSKSRVRWIAMQLVRKYRKVYARHCDNPEIISGANNTYPIDAEIMDVADTISIAEATPGVKVVICHVSCMESARIILRAQKAGHQIAIEICPHYLWFDAEGTNWKKELDPVFYKCFNNLRSSADREYLVKLLKTDNPLIFIGSDNAPHTAFEKAAKSMGGLPSNQEMIAIICTLAHKHKISEKRVAELLSWNAGKHLGIKVPHTMVPHRLELHTDRIKYNDGAVVNPWDGSTMLFPIKEVT